MRLFVPCAIAILSFLPSSGHAQAPSDPPAKKAAAQNEAGEPVKQFAKLKIENPDPSLNGEEFKDEEWGFTIRLPRDFKAIDAAQLEATRKALIPPETERVLPSGNIQKKQVFIFDDGRGGRMLIEAYDPPLQLGNPVQFRNFILNKARESGMKIAESGKPLEFQALGGRIGSVAQFEMQQPNGALVQQLVAAIRAGSRSFLLYASAERDKFMGYEKAYQQALITIALRTDASEAGENVTLVESRHWSGKRATLTVAFNIALLVALLYACTKLLRSSAAPIASDPA